jgi:hypothetical protein
MGPLDIGGIIIAAGPPMYAGMPAIGAWPANEEGGGM